MGQAPLQHMEKAGVIPPTMTQQKLQSYANELKQVVTLSYKSFLASVHQLNEITESFCDLRGKQLQFQIKKRTDSTIFWKGTVRIRCHKIVRCTGRIESTRILTLKEYIHLYNEITKQASMTNLETEGPQALYASVILDEFNQQYGCQDQDENECCICMDNKATVILSCSHTYCEECIDKWQVNNKTCPICRAEVSGADDAWVLTEKPGKEEMAYEARDYLVGLADRTGLPTDGTDTTISTSPYLSTSSSSSTTMT